MKLSLVISTLGRTDCFERLFDSLDAQTMQDFEVILVDQNDGDVLTKRLQEIKPSFPLKYIHTPRERGLSRGRNKGLAHVRGEIVLFPDDDCWYPADFLAKSLSLMKKMRVDILTGRAADEGGRSINGRFEVEAQKISRQNVWTTGIEWVSFFKKDVLDAIDGYDETIGIGADSPWQACEGQDIILRALKRDFAAYYSPDLFGHHEELDTSTPDEKMRQKGLGYARGFGRVARVHGFSPMIALYWSARAVASASISAATFKWLRARYLMQVARGRMEGYFLYGARR